MPERVVIAGGGLAGARTIDALREQGYAGSIVLVGHEEHRPYDRPPLSKALLMGQVDDSTLPTAYDGVELRLGETATGVGDGVLETDRGSVDYDALVIATGSTPIHLPGPDDLVYYLRTVDDARALRVMFQPGAEMVIVGAGWIGAEVATAARKAGVEVTVVEMADAPLAGALGVEVGAKTAGWYQEAGVKLHLGVAVDAIEDDGVHLADGTHLEADCVVVGIGVRPTDEWLGESPIETDVGVLVDDHLRSSMPNVYAAGDVAAWQSGRFGTRLRIEHWDDALHAPSVVAANICGGDEVHDPVPYFWSEQFGRMVQFVGYHRGADEFVWRGDPSDRQWAGCWLRDGVLEAVVTCDRPRDLVQAKKGIANRVVPDREKLADPETALKSCW